MLVEATTLEEDGVFHHLCPLAKLQRFDFERQDDKVILEENFKGWRSKP